MSQVWLAETFEGGDVVGLSIWTGTKTCRQTQTLVQPPPKKKKSVFHYNVVLRSVCSLNSQRRNPA